jgi:hypothetical protein
MRRILPNRANAHWRSHRNGLSLLVILVIAATLGTLALAGVFSNEASPQTKQGVPAVSARTLKALERLSRTKQPPLYYLGRYYKGLPLVGVDKSDPEVNLIYADCTMRELNTLDPRCRRRISVELWPPVPGEISTQGRCTFSGLVRNATAARFPSSPQTLRVFAKETTVDISAKSLYESLAAARALQGLNVRLTPSEPLPSRDVSRQLGRCRPPKKQPPLTAKQRYEKQMLQSWTVESASELSLPDPAYAADSRAVAQSFVTDVGTFPLLLRNEATRLSGVRAPTAVAGLQARLVSELRAYADDVDLALEIVRNGAWHDKPAYASKSKELEARFRRHSRAIIAIVTSFQTRGYVIALESGD